MDPSRSVLHDLDLTPELLASQGSALRALARRLLGDAHEAEDVVQDTWLATLRQGASVRGRVSGWLARVVRNRSLQTQRGAARRRGRELDVARPERLDADPEALLARQEALRAVTESLLELDEPYRVVLLLRFYEDRAPIEIARALELPPTTVKSRLERGLELLRARLAARGHRERHHAGLLLLAGRPAGTGAGPISLGIGTLGTLVMGSKTLLATAAAALACGLLWNWSGSDDETPPGDVPVVAAASAPLAPAAGAEPASRQEAPSAREPVAEASVDAGAAQAVAGFEPSLLVHVRDGDGLPFSGAEIRVGYRGGRMQSIGSTDASGAAALRFPSASATLELLVEVRGGGESSGIRRVELVDGRETRLDLGLHTRQSNQRVIRLETRLDTTERFVELSPGLVQGASLTVSSDWIHSGDRARRISFEEPPPGGVCTRERIESPVGILSDFMVASGENTGALIAMYANRFDTGPSVQLEIVTHSPEAAAHVRGLVRDAHGDPVGQAALAVASLEGPFERRGVTDDEGRFEIEVPGGETLRLRAGGGDVGLDEIELSPKPGEDLAWDPLLARGGEIIGRVVGPEGRPLGGRRVELVQSGPGLLWTAVTETRDDGRFAVPNLPPGLFDVVVLERTDGGMIPARTIARVAAGEDLGVIALAEHELGNGTISVAARDLAGNAAPDSVLRLWHEDSDRVLETSEAPSDAEPGTLACAGLPSGHYGIEVLCDLGEQWLGSVWLDPTDELGPGDTLDLGEASFRSLGTLALVVEDGQHVPDLALRRLHEAIEAHVLDLAGPTTLALRPGQYALDGSKRVARARFAVAAGEVTALAFTADEEGLGFEPTVAPFAASAQGCTSCHAH